MSANLYLKRAILVLVSILVLFPVFSQTKSRQRNIIYVLDCTGSMGGYNGAPNIWAPTKQFLKSELVKEAKENNGSRVTILPFQQKVLQPINVDLTNKEAWPEIENTLDVYLAQLTATNICDSWLEGEKYIDESCDNYLVLMTDGHDNIGGSANESKRIDLLGQILKNFCGKYKNTKGFYVELTKAAALPQVIELSIQNCDDLYKIDASEGIPTFGCISDNQINVNTRDLPKDVVLGFSNSGTFASKLIEEGNELVNLSLKDDKISKGKIVLHIESKVGNDTEILNKAIGAPTTDISFDIESDDVIITNPEMNLTLHAIPLRTLDIKLSDKDNVTEIERTKPFLWVKGNESDTLIWHIETEFSDEAVANHSSAIFSIHCDKDMSDCRMIFNGEEIANDSKAMITPGENALIEIIVPSEVDDRDFNITLTEVESTNLDRINGEDPASATVMLGGNVDTSTSATEIVTWCLAGLIVLFLLLWFLIVRNLKYPKFNRGIIVIQSPYYASLKVKGYRLVVMTAHQQKQGFFDRIWKGKILYHVHLEWVSDVEITPSGKNMRFRCASGQLICDPTPVLTCGSSYKIIDKTNTNSKIDVTIN